MPGIPGHHSDRIFFFQELEPYHRHSVPCVGSVLVYHNGSWPGSHVLAAHSTAEQLLPAS